ncbi:helix-turn-helix domain-containing protein [Hutsoniella sourekii]|uniref:helix-turn-helix domain-containing protein n=1 Tax=Hutsoniella sourekii TaxID=87650 RepID=UPI000486021D|nr:helix-turn-helix domain-containing protein [Hutsoniella sourekii]
MAKYSLEFKIKIVAEYLSGTISLKALANKYHFKSTKHIRIWINAYQTLGIEGLKRSRKNKSYSVEFKLKAIMMYETSEKSYQDLANELELNNPTLITRWHREYRNNGIEGLSRKQGRPTMSKKKESKSQKQSVSQPLKVTDLEQANKRIEELEYELKMQTIKNKYLEMLRSLRIQKTTKTKQESSTSSDKKKNIP